MIQRLTRDEECLGEEQKVINCGQRKTPRSNIGAKTSMMRRIHSYKIQRQRKSENRVTEKGMCLEDMGNRKRASAAKHSKHEEYDLKPSESVDKGQSPETYKGPRSLQVLLQVY